ncbi:MAG TPA: amino acid ABC transporter substrate-binding protein [Acidimicrobiia bacterium]|nr:amino acid ABC transporter substrate-binding protein [Acidimicrobiia bacterium]
MKRIKLLALISALMLVITACTTDGNGDETTTTAADGGSEDNGNTGDEGGTLAAVIAADQVVCGVNDTLPGFGVVDDAGEYSGFDIDFCRAVAAAVLGDASKVEFFPLTAEARFPALQAGEIDLMVRNTTWTATRDGQEGATFLFTTFYDGQGMMVPASTGFTTLEDLENANICVLSGTTTELNLTAVFEARGIAFNPVVFEDNTQLRPAYESGQCEAWTSDASQIGSWKFTLESEGGEDQFIMEEIFSKEPLGPVVADGDTQWAQAVEWAIMATVQAWEFGLDSTNIGSYSGDDPNIQNFISGGDAAAGLNLPADFAVQVIEQVGNYEEIYNRYPELAPLEGSVNDLWSNGGLMYVPPFR